MVYGGRYVRLAAGDPGLFSGLLKTVAKVAAPVAKVVGSVSKIPVIGKVAQMIPGVGTVVTGASLAGSALGALSKTKAGAAALQMARGAFGGSPVTKGPLMLGGKQLLPSRPGIGSMIGTGTAIGGALGLGAMTGRALVGGGTKKKRATRTAPAASGGRRRRPFGAAATRGRCGCKKGTRKVCFPVRKSRGTRTAAQRRFAAASKRYGGRIPKGARL